MCKNLPSSLIETFSVLLTPSFLSSFHHFPSILLQLKPLHLSTLSIIIIAPIAVVSFCILIVVVLWCTTWKHLHPTVKGPTNKYVYDPELNGQNGGSNGFSNMGYGVSVCDHVVYVLSIMVALYLFACGIWWGHCMGITCTLHGCHMHLAWVSHAPCMGVT